MWLMAECGSWTITSLSSAHGFERKACLSDLWHNVSYRPLAANGVSFCPKQHIVTQHEEKQGVNDVQNHLVVTQQ